MQSPELTKRKHHHSTSIDVLSSPEKVSSSGKNKSKELITEYDTRPSFANEPPMRYEKQGDQLIPIITTKRSTYHQKSKIYQFIQCFTFNTLQRELIEMFLPAGYPESVSEDYLVFQFWDTIQAMCSYLRGVLATQSVLESVGVGDENKTPLAAAVQWVLRDGSGMLGGLAFAYFVGPKFDANVKRWRLFADFANDIGLTFDMIAPYFPAYVTYILCFSSIAKTMCGVAAGSTRSSLMAHFAKRDNMADCAAKERSQETAVMLFGLIFGMYFANVVNASRTSVWIAFIILSFVHMYANFKAVHGLCIPTINRLRALNLILRFRTTLGSSENQKRNHSKLLSVRSINEAEPIVTEPNLPIGNISMGSRIWDAIETPSELEQLVHLYREEAYLLTFQGRRIRVVCKTNLQPLDELRAFYNATVLLQALEEEEEEKEEEEKKKDNKSKEQVLFNAYTNMKNEFELFFEKIQSNGWKTHLFLLGTSSLRVKVNHSSSSTSSY